MIRGQSSGPAVSSTRLSEIFTISISVEGLGPAMIDAALFLSNRNEETTKLVKPLLTLDGIKLGDILLLEDARERPGAGRACSRQGTGLRTPIDGDQGQYHPCLINTFRQWAQSKS